MSGAAASGDTAASGSGMPRDDGATKALVSERTANILKERIGCTRFCDSSHLRLSSNLLQKAN